MIPILFDKAETDFTSNGLGRLECITCTVTEERNGIYELEATIPEKGNHASDVAMDSIIGVIPSDGASLQGFRVYQITKPINGKFTVYARHISYQLLDIPCMPFSVPASPDTPSDPTDCATTLATLKTNAFETCPFSFWTDVTSLGRYNQTVPASIRTRLLGTEGSVLDQFGGEYEWDNWTVKLHNKRGSIAEVNGIQLRYGKNITDLNQEENISNVITGVVPYWADSDGNLVVLPNKEVVYSQYASAYPFHRTVPLDLSDKWEEAPSESTLRTAAEAFVNSSELGLPKVSIKVSFVALWQSEEYKDVLPLQRVKLCDEITVVFEKYGISRVAKIVKTTYNVLKERYDSIEVGSIRSSFSSTISDQEAANAIAIAAQAVSTQTAINNATKWLTTSGGYVIAIKYGDEEPNKKGTWKELVFSNDTNPYDPHASILRINEHGLGFSYYTDDEHIGGINGEYRQAWTIDGNLIADWIHGGTLTLGGLNNSNGWMQILNASGQQIGKWDKDGADITGKLTAKDSHGTAKIENGVIVLNADTGRSMLSMTRGDYYLALSATDAYFEDNDSHFSVQSTWDNIIAVAKYFDDHGGWA